MKNKWLLYTAFLINLIIMVGCSSPNKQYQKLIDKTDLSGNMIILRNLSDESMIQLKNLVLNEEEDSEKSEAIVELVEMLHSVKNESVVFQENHQELAEYHQNLENVIRQYDELAETLEDSIHTVQDLNLQIKTIEEHFEAIKNIVLAGESTSFEYNEELNDFMSTHIQELGLFDLSIMNELLTQDPLDLEKMKTVVDKAIPVLEELKSINTMTETDHQVNELLVEMAQGILMMIEYTLLKQEEIQAINQDTFILELEKKLSEASSSLDSWLLLTED